MLLGHDRSVLESKTHSWKGERREMERELENRRLDGFVVVVAAATETMAFLLSRFSLLSSSS